MIVSSLALLGLLAVADPAAAPRAEVMAKIAPAFRGVIVNTYPDGRKGRLYLSAGHTYRYVGRTQSKSSGVWSLNDAQDKICLKQRQPHPIPFSYCTVIPNGRSWTAKAPGGESVRVTLVSGR